MTVRKLLFLSCVCALMTGCAAQLISSNERTVIVQARVPDLAGAQAVADAECKKVGRYARYTGQGPMVMQFVFDCVQ